MDESVRLAVERVERSAAEGDVGYLIEALKSQTREVRIAAAEALGRVGGDKAALALLSLAREHPGERPDVRIAALKALGSIHGRDRYASILQEFLTGDNSKVVAAARLMLSEVDPEGYPRRLAERGCLDHAAIKVYGTAVKMPRSRFSWGSSGTWSRPVRSRAPLTGERRTPL